MEKNNPLNELINNTMEHLSAAADANTIIGTPIQTDGVTLIPVSRLSYGVIGGGTEYTTKNQAAQGKPAEPNFGGGTSASAKLDPVAFLVIRGNDVKLLPVNPFPPTPIDRVIETVPEVVDKVSDFIERQQEKKAAKEAPAAAEPASDFEE